MFKQKLGYLPYFICLLASSFYLYEFILQVSPSVITEELMRELAIDATQLGLVSAFFYYAYTPMQLPAGLLYDRFGPRVLLTLATAICVIGAFLFGLAHSPWQAAIGRACMGVGGAFSFIGALVLVSRWFPPSYFAMIAGLVQFMSSIGSMAGSKPLAYSVQSFGWRNCIIALAIVGIVLVAMIWLFVKDYPKGKEPQRNRAVTPRKRFGLDEIQRLRLVLSKPQTWAIAAYSFAIWAPVLCFAALWGVPFLKARFGVTDVVASGMNMMIWLGVGIASPAIGYISNRIQRRSSPLYVMALLGLFSSLIILFVENLPHFMMYFLLLIYGFAVAGQSLAFAVINDISERHLVGTAIGINNMAVVAGGAIFQPLIGRILDWQSDGTIINGIPHYTLSMYQAGLMIVPVCFAVCFIISYWFIRETYCEPSFPETGDNKPSAPTTTLRKGNDKSQSNDDLVLAEAVE